MKIEDEFTNLPISRQRKWQLRRARDGGCHICGKKRKTAFLCEKHAKAQSKWQKRNAKK